MSSQESEQPASGLPWWLVEKLTPEELEQRSAAIRDEAAVTPVQDTRELKQELISDSRRFYFGAESDRVKARYEALKDPVHHEMCVVVETEQLRIRDEARKRFEDEENEPIELHRASDDILTLDDRVDFLIDGWWRAGSFGVVGGPEKTLKSFIMQATAWSVLSGDPLWGRLEVLHTGRVVVFVGEGSRQDWELSVRKIAQAHGRDDAEIRRLADGLFITDKVAPLESRRFEQVYNNALAEMAPALVIVDPTYPFMSGVDNQAGNLYRVGPLLQRHLSAPAVEAGAALQVGHHARKDIGDEMTLADLTQAGFREWAASWVLTWHRSPPFLAAGAFDLGLKVGGRGWTTQEASLSISMGPWDSQLRRFLGPISWGLHRPGDLVAPDELQRQAHAFLNRKRSALEIHAMRLAVTLREAGISPHNAMTMGALRSLLAELLGTKSRTRQDDVINSAIEAGLIERGPGSRNSQLHWPTEAF